MKKVINKNTILGLVVGIIISGVTVYAVETKYKADNIQYKETTVKAALDYLYSNNLIERNIENVLFSESYGTQDMNRSVSLDLTKGKYLVVANTSEGVKDRWGDNNPTNGYLGKLECSNDNCEINVVKSRYYGLNGNHATLFHSLAIFKVEIKDENETLLYRNTWGNNDANNPESIELYALRISY